MKQATRSIVKSHIQTRLPSDTCPGGAPLSGRAGGAVNRVKMPAEYSAVLLDPLFTNSLMTGLGLFKGKPHKVWNISRSPWTLQSLARDGPEGLMSG